MRKIRRAASNIAMGHMRSVIRRLPTPVVTVMNARKLLLIAKDD